MWDSRDMYEIGTPGKQDDSAKIWILRDRDRPVLGLGTASTKNIGQNEYAVQKRGKHPSSWIWEYSLFGTFCCIYGE